MNDKNFITHPSKKVLVVFTILVIFVFVLNIWSCFNDDGKIRIPNPILLLIMLMNVVNLFTLYSNYFRNTRKV